MVTGMIGKKLGMTQIYSEDRRLTPVTVLQVGPCSVVQVKTEEKEGYNAVQIGFGPARERRVTQPLRGHFSKAGVQTMHVLKEVRVDDPDEYQLGQTLTVGVFESVAKVDVTGVSKGRGFTGVMKRWGFHGQPASHGSKTHRAAGSIGMAATPSRVLKGMKMAGHHGNARRTARNLKVMAVDTERGLLLVKGAVPGPKNSYVFVRCASS